MILVLQASGVARGEAARPGCHHFGVTPFGFFSFQSENPLIGRQRPFFLVITYFRTENQLVLQRRPFFFFGLRLYFGRYRVPPRNPAPGATILSDASATSLQPEEVTKGGDKAFSGRGGAKIVFVANTMHIHLHSSLKNLTFEINNDQNISYMREELGIL